MKAFLLAAGKGTRMRPLTENTPKPLLPIAGKPALQHLIDSLEETMDEIIILVGWEGGKIKEGVGSSEAELRFVRQEEQSGTADAISYAESFVDDEFVCMNADVLMPKNVLTDFVKSFSKTENSMMGLAEVKDPYNYGVVTTEGKKVKEIIEKPEDPPESKVNSGLYGFTEEIFDAIDKTEKSSRGEYEITDSLKIMMEDSNIEHFKIEEWHELSRPWDLLSTNEEIMQDTFEEDIKGEVKKNVHVEGPVQISEGATIKEGSYIIGPVYIGKDAEIGPNCHIRPSTHIGSDCKVGAASEVKNSIIMKGTQVPHHNYVGDSVIGKDCNFGSGTKVANLRLDDKNIKVIHRGEKVDTGRRKLGVIMGDDVKTGINSMINPGTIIWERCFIGPGALAQSEIGPESKIQ